MDEAPPKGPEALAARMRWVLRARGLTQRGLARRAGLAEPHVRELLQRLEEDGGTIELRTVIALAQGAGVSVGWLATGEGNVESGADGASIDPRDPRATIGDRVRYALGVRGMSQNDLERRLASGSGVVSRIISRRASPTADTLRKLRSALRVSYDWLIDGVGEMDDERA